MNEQELRQITDNEKTISLKLFALSWADVEWFEIFQEIGKEVEKLEQFLEAIKFAAEMLFQPNIIGEARKIAERELKEAIDACGGPR